MRLLHRLLRLNEGQDLLEYGVLASLIALVALGAVGLLGDHIEQSFLAGHWSKHLTSSLLAAMCAGLGTCRQSSTFGTGAFRMSSVSQPRRPV